jgi:hypothetical protein
MKLACLFSYRDGRGQMLENTGSTMSIRWLYSRNLLAHGPDPGGAAGTVQCMVESAGPGQHQGPVVQGPGLHQLKTSSSEPPR